MAGPGPSSYLCVYQDLGGPEGLEVWDGGPHTDFLRKEKL